VAHARRTAHQHCRVARAGVHQRARAQVREIVMFIHAHRRHQARRCTVDWLTTSCWCVTVCCVRTRRALLQAATDAYELRLALPDDALHTRIALCLPLVRCCVTAMRASTCACTVLHQRHGSTRANWTSARTSDIRRDDAMC
jgi:hypothetical protein